MIDDYLSNATPEQRRELNRVRKIAKDLVPEAEEVISYGIPTLKYKGKHLIYFAYFTHHMSIFPGSKLSDSLKTQLQDYTFGEGTIQFTGKKPIPASAIKEIVLTRKAYSDEKR